MPHAKVNQLESIAINFAAPEPLDCEALCATTVQLPRKIINSTLFKGSEREFWHLSRMLDSTRGSINLPLVGLERKTTLGIIWPREIRWSIHPGAIYVIIAGPVSAGIRRVGIGAGSWSCMKLFPGYVTGRREYPIVVAAATSSLSALSRRVLSVFRAIYQQYRVVFLPVPAAAEWTVGKVGRMRRGRPAFSDFKWNWIEYKHAKGYRVYRRRTLRQLNDVNGWTLSLSGFFRYVCSATASIDVRSHREAGCRVAKRSHGAYLNVVQWSCLASGKENGPAMSKAFVHRLNYGSTLILWHCARIASEGR